VENETVEATMTDQPGNATSDRVWDDVEVQGDPLAKKADGIGGLLSFGTRTKEAEKKEPEKSAETSPVEGKEEKAEKVEETPKEQPTKSTEADPKASEFTNQVIEKLNGLGLTDEDKAKFIPEVLENWGKWTAKVNQRTQEVAKREAELGDLELLDRFSKFTSAKDVVSAIEKLQKMDLPGFLNLASEQYFEGGENPVKEFFDLLFKSAPEAQKMTKQQMDLKQQAEDLKLEKEVSQVQALDPRYSDPELGQKNLEELAALADSLGDVPLTVAHKVYKAEQTEKALNESNVKVKALTKELLDVKKELDALKQKSPTPKKEPAENKYDEPVVVGNWNDTVGNIHQQTRIKMGI
jgi:hypothetical protein